MRTRLLLWFSLGLVAGAVLGGLLGFAVGQPLYEWEMGRHPPIDGPDAEERELMLRNFASWIVAGCTMVGIFFGGVLGVAWVGIRNAKYRDLGDDLR